MSQRSASFKQLPNTVSVGYLWMVKSLSCIQGGSGGCEEKAVSQRAVDVEQAAQGNECPEWWSLGSPGTPLSDGGFLKEQSGTFSLVLSSISAAQCFCLLSQNHRIWGVGRSWKGPTRMTEPKPWLHAALPKIQTRCLRAVPKYWAFEGWDLRMFDNQSSKRCSGISVVFGMVDIYREWEMKK